MAIKGGRIERFIQNELLRPLRLRAIINIIKKLPSGTILDLGCMDDYLLKRLPERFNYYGIDDEPLCKNPKIEKKKVEDLKDNQKYDIVLATEVLEHLHDPVAGMKKLKQLSKRFIIISVPNEPFFSFFRFFLPAKEHLWTIFPSALKANLGKPVLEKTACFRRTYIGVWEKKTI
jgi:2-polyprenyl-3-methyl-5-hydroxy-6-metoxy-1,4-benzoquinol methylase